MSKRSIIIIIALLVAVVAVATALDLLGVGRRFPRFWTDILPPTAANARLHEDIQPLILTRLSLPRAVRVLASIGSLVGLGLLLIYLMPHRLTTLVHALEQRPARLARYALYGLVVLLLMLALTVLAALSLIVALLTPVFGVSLGVALMIGLVAFAMASGRRLRMWLGAPEDSSTADLLTGLTALVLLSLFPYLGPLVLISGGLIGLGAVATTRFGVGVGTLAR